jgi:hypothetical protein
LIAIDLLVDQRGHAHPPNTKRQQPPCHGQPAASPVDRIGTALTTGFNLGIYKSLETQVVIQDARTGEIVQTLTNKNW